MIFQSRASLVLAMSLAALAGFTDAVGFRTLNGLFVSFMSGNSTRLAVNISQPQQLLMDLIPLGLIIVFVMGVMAGAIVRHKIPYRKQAGVLAFVSVALTGAALASAFNQNNIAVILMLLAMGAANNAFVTEGEVSVGVTYMTGTLVKFGQRLAANLFKIKKTSCFPYLGIWFGLVFGAIAGSISYSFLSLDCLWMAAFFSAALFLAAFMCSAVENTQPN